MAEAAPAGARPRRRGERQAEILQALAAELERCPGSRITTAALAESLGLSEAALYRHFPSKARMFEGLLAFAEEAVFELINRILAEHAAAATRCERIAFVMLTFAERNPGIARVLTGDALLGEDPRLRARTSQFFDRIETQLRQILRERAAAASQRERAEVPAAAALIAAVVAGRIGGFVRSEFKALPAAGWDAQWQLLSRAVFPDEPSR